MNLVTVVLPDHIPSDAKVSPKWSVEAYLKLRCDEPSIINIPDRVVQTAPQIVVRALPGEEIHASWVENGGADAETPSDPADTYFYTDLAAATATAIDSVTPTEGETTSQLLVMNPKRWGIPWKFH